MKGRLQPRRIFANVQADFVFYPLAAWRSHGVELLLSRNYASPRSFLRARDRIAPMLLTGIFSWVLISS
jgi:hypothetical protein